MNFLVKQVNHLTARFRQESFALAMQADMKFAHNLPPLINACQKFSKVYPFPVVPENSCASGDGIKAATSGHTVVVFSNTLGILHLLFHSSNDELLIFFQLCYISLNVCSLVFSLRHVHLDSGVSLWIL